MDNKFLDSNCCEVLRELFLVNLTHLLVKFSILTDQGYCVSIRAYFRLCIENTAGLDNSIRTYISIHFHRYCIFVFDNVLFTS